MSEPLDTTPVYRNLTFRSAFFGLTPLDMPVMLVPGGAVFLASMLFGVSTIWGFITAMAVGAGLIALKWRKPDDYLETLIHTALAPRRLSHKERDAVVLPFPLDGSLRVRAAHMGRDSAGLAAAPLLASRAAQRAVSPPAPAEPAAGPLSCPPRRSASRLPGASNSSKRPTGGVDEQRRSTEEERRSTVEHEPPHARHGSRPDAKPSAARFFEGDAESRFGPDEQLAAAVDAVRAKEIT